MVIENKDCDIFVFFCKLFDFLHVLKAIML